MGQEVYDVLINYICATGTIPMSWIDNICAEARRQINSAFALADGNRKSRKSRRTTEIWGGINAERKIFKSIWFDNESEWIDNVKN